ncbi:MAG: hypothetical protein WCA37_12890, partial [Terracidiphilus sp.]
MLAVRRGDAAGSQESRPPCSPERPDRRLEGEKKMKGSTVHCTLLAVVACFATGTAMGQVESKAQSAAPITASIDVRQTAAPVSNYEFGMFIEHIGTLIYRSLWAEMIDDRKFYFPINSKVDDEAAHRAGPGFRGMQLRKWRPVGPDDVVVMDENHPFVGDHSPRIALDSSVPHGIRQSGLSLVKGKTYTGRIYLRGTPGSKVQVALIWGSSKNDRQTISFADLTDAYRKFSLHFTAQADSSDAILEITATGSGSFHIGTVSLMPSDNVQGFRPDTIALLKQI